MNLKRLARWASAALIGVATVTSLNVAAETAALRVSIEGGSFNSKFKFWDASKGCPSYHDIPGAKDFMGGVRASDKGADKKLTVGQPVHVFMYRPKDYPGISAAGLFTEIRRRFTSTSTSSPITVSGLTNDVAYTCTVTATNSVGTSSASAATAPITPEETSTGLPIWLLYQATQ